MSSGGSGGSDGVGSLCPVCGGEPVATTQDASTGEAWYECRLMHQWKMVPEEGG